MKICNNKKTNKITAVFIAIILFAIFSTTTFADDTSSSISQNETTQIQPSVAVTQNAQVENLQNTQNIANTTSTPTINLLKQVEILTQIKEGEKLNLYAIAEGVPNTSTLSYQWYKDNVLISGATNENYTIEKATTKDSGTYDLHITNTADGTKIITSGSVTVSTNSDNSTTPATGSLAVTAYTVQNAVGAELQRVEVGEKCQIIIALRDGRLNTIPTKLDGYGNIANAKITSTSSFSSPTFGDIGFTSPKIVNGALEYAVIFNDITYLGGENTLAFDLAYNDVSVPMQNVSVGMSQMLNPEEISTTQPVVMVKSSSYGNTAVNAGEIFNLSISSFNTSDEQALVDVMTSITLPSNLVLAGGSNVFLHKNVVASGVFGDNFTLQASNSASTGIENITVNYTYYVEGTDVQLTSSQIITVAVEQPDRFSFTSSEMPTEVYVGQDSYITVGFVNKGKGILYNLSAEVTGNITEPGQVQYIGNLNSGTEGSVDFILNANDTSPVFGEILISYEDINGAVQTHTQQYSFTPVEMNTGGNIMTPGFDDFEQAESEGMPEWLWGLIVFAIIGALIAVVLIVNKKHKAKILKSQLELEDDDDEDI